MIDALHSDPYVFKLFYGYDVDDNQSFDEAMAKLEAMRPVCKQTRDVIDNSSFWQLFAQKCYISLPINTRKDLYELVVKKLIPKQKIMSFINSSFDKSIKNPTTLRLIRELNRQFASKECIEKLNLQVLWENLQRQYNIKDINLVRKHVEEKFSDPRVTSEQKTEEFKKWLDKHPELYNIEELKIDRYMLNLTTIPPQIQYLPKLRALDFTNCRFLDLKSIADINLKDIEKISGTVRHIDTAEKICMDLKDRCFKEGIEKVINYETHDGYDLTKKTVTFHIDPFLPRTVRFHVDPLISPIPQLIPSTPELQFSDDEDSKENIEKVIKYETHDGYGWTNRTVTFDIDPLITPIPPEPQLSDDEDSKENSVLGKHYIEDWSDDFPAKKHHPSDDDFQFDWNGDIW